MLVHPLVDSACLQVEWLGVLVLRTEVCFTTMLKFCSLAKPRDYAVNSNGKAALKGIREGDIITSINGHPTKDLKYSDAHSLIKNSEDPLRLELTVDAGSPKHKKRNRATLHETHSETLKSTSSTLYSRNSTKTFFNDENEYADPDQYLRKPASDERQNNFKEHIEPPLSPDSTVSSDVSSCSTLTEAGGKAPCYISTTLISSSIQNSLTMADCANPKTKRKRSKNQRRRQRKNAANAHHLPHTDETNSNENIVKEEYKVDFPDAGASKPKLKIKSKSLDDEDDSVKIQEVEESVEEDKHQCEAIVSEADSDWEETTELRIPQNPASLSTIAISIDEEPLQRVGNFSPEEELTLRNFLEGINLINSPGCQSSVSTLDSIKMEKARKRDALMKYFTPLANNPRFLDIISEEGSDLSDRESSTLTRHLKQGTPELENLNQSAPTQVPRFSKRNKLKRLQLKRNEEKAVLVCTKMLDSPSIIEHIHTHTSENVEPEKVYLESSSDNASSENSSGTGVSTPSEQEEQSDANIVVEGSEKNSNHVEEESQDGKTIKTFETETDVIEENAELKFKSPVIQTTITEVGAEGSAESNQKSMPIQNSSEYVSVDTNYNIPNDYAELTPPPTPELSPKKKLSTDSIVDLDWDECMKEIACDTAREITSVLCKLEQVSSTTFIVNQAVIPSPERPKIQSLTVQSPSHSSSSSRETSPSTVRLNPMTSSIADVASILTDLEIAKEASSLKQPLSLRQSCLEFLLTSPHGTRLMRELSEVSDKFEKLAEAGNETKEKLEIAASLNPINMQDDNNSNLISEVTEKLKQIMSSKKWAGLPFYNNPNLLLYLSPKQRSELERSEVIMNEPEILYDLHSKFSERMGSKDAKCSQDRRIEITSFEKETMHKTSDTSYSMSTSKTFPRNFKESHCNPRLQVSNLDDWLDIARGSDKIEQQEHTSSSDKKTEFETTEKSTSSRRRTSLPDEIYRRQLQMILEKEKEIEKELESLLEEKRKLFIEMRNTEENSTGNIKHRPKSFPQSPSETLRQKMYEEYMRQVAEREERKHHKMIKITSTPPNKNLESDKPQFEAVHLPGIEDEFMKRVQEKHGPLEKVEEETMQKDENIEESDTKISQVLLIDGNSVKEATDLPKHLKEFVEITADDTSGETNPDSANGKLCKCRNKYCKDARRINRVLQRNRYKRNISLLHEIDAELDIAKGFLLGKGIWSPGQKQELTQAAFDKQKHQQKNEESIPSIWQPKSATSSPVAERKEYRPISFESPKLGRKNKSQEFQVNKSFEKSTSRPWQDSVSRGDLPQSSTLDRRIPNSKSAPATGINEFTIGRLPRAQNPTVTLLQKAREGQLPKGAHYIEANRDHYRIPHDFSDQGEIIHPRRNDHYYSESDSEILHKAGSNRQKVEGVGPVTSNGMPLSLRSEVRDSNQSKWYKKMYDTIHKQKPYRAQYPYISGYLSEPEPATYESDHMDYKYATLDRRRTPVNEKENFTTSTMPRNAQFKTTSASDYSLGSKLNPGRIENYIPGRSSISEQESKKWWDEVMDIFDGWMDDVEGIHSLRTMPMFDTKMEDERKPITKGYMSQALKESGYESDSTLVFRKKEDGSQISPSEQKEAYKIIQKGGDIPLHGLRKAAPERPKEPESPVPPAKSQQGQSKGSQEGSPRKYVENQVTIHYKTPVRQEVKDYFSEDELAHRQQEAMKKMYQEERRRKYLQVSKSFYKSFDELQDMHNRRHTDNFIPSQKSPIPLNRYDDFDDLVAPQHRIRPRSPEPRLVAKALYNFVGMTPRELTFRKGDNIYVRRQIDKNWYEGELNAMVGLFPVNYVEIVPYENVKSTTPARKPNEGQARAKYNFLAKTHLELSLAKGEMVIITKRVDNNWYEGKIGGRKGIFPASYVDVLIDPQEPPKENPKPVAAPAAHSLLLNGSSLRESMGSHTYTPNAPIQDQGQVSSYYAKPVQANYCSSYGGRKTAESNNPMNQALHIDTQSADPIPYRALYKYQPQNDDELELMEGDTIYVLEKCDDGWYVGSNERTGAFGTFPGNYVEKV
ncbi:uncharacterized protein LOC123315648 isoform X4 [Coccinella septempunctata]|uniref:uncharacterized protein LOC123315648 isoform X4 n=1 Tax=Coccinella septempunctata TaxID=41139 RepID=UPI001D08B4C5|nr:uncharacterized protein LOC123315648 isoform X4 [Coccinella septempunctata]